MSIWSIFRGPNSDSNKPSREEKAEKLNTSILTLRKVIDTHEKRRVFLEKRIENLTKEAQEALKQKNRKAALYAIKKKKLVEKQLTTIEGKIFNLEAQILTLEDASAAQQTLDAMTTARDAMHAAVNAETLDQAADLADDMADAVAQVEQFNDIMSQPIVEFDEDELLAELDDLDEEDLNLIPEQTVPATVQRQDEVVKDAVPEEETIVTPETEPAQVVNRLTEEDEEDLRELDRMEIAMSAQVVVEMPATCAMEVDFEEAPHRFIDGRQFGMAQ